MKNLGYLQCQRGGYHSGEFLNIICLNSNCKNDILCCCACVQQLHPTHKTKTLKKLLLDAEALIKNQPQISKPQKKQQKTSLNTDIMANMVENEQKHIISKLQQLKHNFIKQIDQLQAGIHTYFKSLYQQLSKPAQNSGKDLKEEIVATIELVQGAGSIQTLQTNVLKLIKNVETMQKLSGFSYSEDEQPDEQSYFNFLKNSNIDINNIVDIKIKDLYSKLQKQTSRLRNINSKISSLWSNKLFKFVPSMHHYNMELINPFTVRANVDSVYQMALMSPGLTFSKQVETFTFRINVNDLDWVAVGVCYKKLAEKGNYSFRYNEQKHGCYMISGNAGTWSHSDPDFNNYVKAFSFKQGDSVTCAVTKNKICFFKNVPPEFEQTLQYSQKEYYELEISPQQNDVLHPCVVSFYQNTEVEYLPSFKNLQLQLPNYKYKFSQKTKHHNLIICNGYHLIGCAPTSYKCCILDKPMQGDGPVNQLKSVTFRIVKSTGNWIGVGLCHKNVVVNKNYDFFFQETGHGCYMVSANGGSWSSIDAEQNNIVKTFKFVEGDLITITLDEQNKKIHYQKGIQKYQLKYNPIAGDKLYPIVVLYYMDDEVDVLPEL